MTTLLRDLKNFEELAYQLAINPTKYAGKAFSINKFGFNLDIDATKEDLWASGGTKTDRTPADTGVVEVVSSDANDTVGGTGAHSITVYGYDADGNFVSDWQELNGTTAVELDLPMMDSYRAIVNSAGSNEYNIGDITVRHKTGPVSIAFIPASFNQTQMSHFIVPKNFTCFFLGGTASIGGVQGGGGAKRGDIHLEVKPNGCQWRVTETFGATSDSGPISLDIKFPFRFPELTHIKASCTAETSNTEAYVQYDMVFINNSEIE